MIGVSDPRTNGQTGCPRAASLLLLPVIDWASRYTADNYDLIGFVDVDIHKGSLYLLPYRGEQISAGANYLAIYQRR